MNTLTQVIELLQTLNTALESVQALDHANTELRKECSEAMRKIRLEMASDKERLADSLRTMVRDEVECLDLDDKIENALHNTDWTDKVYEAVNDLTFSVEVNH